VLQTNFRYGSIPDSVAENWPGAAYGQEQTFETVLTNRACLYRRDKLNCLLLATEAIVFLKGHVATRKGNLVKRPLI
jgi:hypothetical protein